MATVRQVAAGMLKAFHKKERTPLGFCEGLDKAFPNFGQEDERGSGPPKYHTNYAPFYPFHKATCRGDIDRVRKFVEHGTAAMEQIDWKSRTALHFACVYGRPEVVELLLKSHCDINPKDSKKATPLIKAAQCQQKRCLVLLLKYGADPNLTDFRGNTALHYAVYNEDFQVAACLLKYNANLEALNENRMTPLLLALKQNKEDIAEFLINRGADIHITDFLGRTTLMYAVRCGSELITNLLLQRGINTNKTDAFGWTAKRYAVESKSKIRKILIDYDEEQLVNQKGNSENKEKGVGSLPTMELKEFLQVEPVEKADTEPLKSEPVLEVPSEKQPKIPIKPESRASFQPLKTFDRMSQQCVHHLSESSEERGRTKGRVLPWVEKDVPSKPSGNVQKSSSDGVEMTMLQPFTSDFCVEQVIEVSSDKDQAKNDSNKNTQHRNFKPLKSDRGKHVQHTKKSERKLFLVKPENDRSSFDMDSYNENEAGISADPKSSVNLRSFPNSSFLSPYSKTVFSEPGLQKKDATPLAGTSVQRRDTMSSLEQKLPGKEVTSTEKQRRQKSNKSRESLNIKSLSSNQGKYVQQTRKSAENDWSLSDMDSDNENEARTSAAQKSSVHLRSFSNSPFLSPHSKTIISEPLPQKKDAAHLAGASVQRRDTMSDFELKMSGKDVTPRKEQRRQESSTSGEPPTFSFKPEPQKKDAFQRREPMGSSKLKVSGKDVTSTADQRRQKSSSSRESLNIKPLNSDQGKYIQKPRKSAPENDWSSFDVDSDNENEAGTSAVPESSVHLRSFSNSPFLSPHPKMIISEPKPRKRDATLAETSVQRRKTMASSELKGTELR